MLDVNWLQCGDYLLDQGDFSECENIVEYELQETMSRLRTSEDEFILDSNEIAANIEKYIGESASNEIVDAIKNRIIHALTYYKYLSSGSKVEVKTKLINADTIGIYLKLSNKDYPSVFINVYMNFEDDIVSFYIEEIGDVRYTH